MAVTANRRRQGLVAYTRSNINVSWDTILQAESYTGGACNWLPLCTEELGPGTKRFALAGSRTPALPLEGANTNRYTTSALRWKTMYFKQYVHGYEQLEQAHGELL